MGWVLDDWPLGRADGDNENSKRRLTHPRAEGSSGRHPIGVGAGLLTAPASTPPACVRCLRVCTSTPQHLEPTMLAFALKPAWWDAFCSTAPYDPVRYDLNPCFSDSTLALVPVVILALGAVASRKVVKQYLAGERPEKGGQGAYGVKLVSRRADRCGSSGTEQAGG